jgi:deoxyhypusine synthase
MATVHDGIEQHFEHFNARELRAAARALEAHLGAGGRLFLAMAGAMSTAGMGRLLARAIRAGLIHGVSCTGANLEEDAYRLIGGDTYEAIPNWAELRGADELDLHRRGLNRVTDAAIPDEVMVALDEQLLYRWQTAAASGRTATAADFLFDALTDPTMTARYREPEASWLLAARDHGIPIWTPGWEDSSSGNAFSAAVMRGDIPSHACVEPGTAQMTRLVRWYMEHCDPAPGIGFLQVGGGIAGDFPICVVPLITKDLQLPDTPLWGYFCQITDADPTYGGYSGAPPGEKISWGKLAEGTPRFSIHSDATIVLPLLLAYVLGD